MFNKWTIAVFLFFCCLSGVIASERAGVQHPTFRQLKQELWSQGVQIVPHWKLGEQTAQESEERQEASLGYPEEIQHIMRKFYAHPLI